MDKNLFIFVLLLILCGQSPKKVEIKFPNGQIKESFIVHKDSNGTEVKQGRYIRYYENCKIAEEGYYKDGKKDSLWIQWAPEGNKKQEDTWMLGLRNGRHIKWNEYYRKEIDEDGVYINDKREGEWKFNWHGYNGRQKGTFKNGMRNGYWVEFYLGKSREKICAAGGNYENDKKSDRWSEYCWFELDYKSFNYLYYNNGIYIKSENNIELEKELYKMQANRGKTSNPLLKEFVQAYKEELYRSGVDTTSSKKIKIYESPGSL
jgi:antitoxin component YwqK of YwqJK toxin-antitoxin module